MDELPERPTGTLRTIVGWAIVAVVVFLLFGAIVGVVRVLFRLLFWLVLLVGLIVLYVRLRPGDD